MISNASVFAAGECKSSVWTRWVFPLIS